MTLISEDLWKLLTFILALISGISMFRLNRANSVLAERKASSQPEIDHAAISRDNAETSKIVAEAAQLLISPLRDEISRLSKEMENRQKDCSGKIKALTDETSKLRSALKAKDLQIGGLRDQLRTASKRIDELEKKIQPCAS